MDDEVRLQKIQEGDESVLKQTYMEYRERFVPWMIKHFHCSKDEAIEHFQLTFSIFLDNIFLGKLYKLTGIMQTYFFSIGKFKYMELERKKISIAKATQNFLTEHIDSELNEEYESQLERVEMALQEIGEPCSKILQMFYYKKFSMKEISEKMAYKNENTTKNMKYKCLKRLQELFQKIPIQKD